MVCSVGRLSLVLMLILHSTILCTTMARRDKRELGENGKKIKKKVDGGVLQMGGKNGEEGGR